MLLADKHYPNLLQNEKKNLLKIFRDNDFGKKYKTEICKNWINGTCKFGKNCIFAHGEGELRTSFQKKNKECENFNNDFFCMYGEKCQFIHKQAKTKRLPIFVDIHRRGV